MHRRLTDVLTSKGCIKKKQKKLRKHRLSLNKNSKRLLSVWMLLAYSKSENSTEVRITTSGLEVNWNNSKNKSNE